MKQFEKWKSEFAKAKDGFDLLYTKSRMEDEMSIWCYEEDGNRNCSKRECDECMREWGNREVKEND